MQTITHLTREHLGEIYRFWRESFPLIRMNETLLEERIFDSPDALPENSLGYFDGNRLFALSLITLPKAAVLKSDAQSGNADMIGGIRAFGVHPDYRARGFGRELMTQSCDGLRAMGATVADFLSTPPYYIQPGIDIRSTEVISWLLHHGFEQYRTNFNMSLDLVKLKPPEFSKIFDRDDKGYGVRRAVEDDLAEFQKFCRGEWPEGWMIEGSLGLRHDPCSLFLAIHRDGAGAEQIVGFAVYEANQGLGCFGPTGVSPAHQGHGLGKRLLWATLIDMKALGRTSSQIGWVGPVEFYHRVAGAALGPVFWGMRKKLTGTEN